MSLATITHGTVAILAGLLVWFFQEARLGADLADERLQAGEYREQVTTERSAANTRVRKAEQAVTAKYQGALNASLKREALQRLELDGLRRVNDGLRDQNADAARRLAAAPPAAVLEYATALGVVFEDCRAAYGDMAAKAAGHASDVVTAHDAWPSFTPVKE